MYMVRKTIEERVLGPMGTDVNTRNWVAGPIAECGND